MATGMAMVVNSGMGSPSDPDRNSSWVSSLSALKVYSNVPSPSESTWTVTPASPCERTVQSIVYSWVAPTAVGMSVAVKVVASPPSMEAIV